MPSRSPSVLDIDLTRLDANLAAWRRAVGPEVGLCCVVKADAYGLGAIPVSRRMQGAGVEMLAVYTADQARELVEAGVTTPLLIMMPVREIGRADALYRALVDGRLHFVAHDAEHATDLLAIADRFGCRLPVHVEIDTGMSRGGAAPDEALRTVERIVDQRRLALAGFMTHFSCAEYDEIVTTIQLERFAQFRAECADRFGVRPPVHAANTGAAARGPRYHLDLVRIGLGWAGYLTDETRRETSEQVSDELRGMVRWTTKLAHVKWIEPETTVGYGRAWTAERPTRVGLVPVGYADGYPLALSNRGEVRLRHAGGWITAPVIGRVSMDQLTIDLTDAPDDASVVGAEVELLSDDPAAPNALPRLARLAESLPYVILCGLSSRVRRRYRLHADRSPEQSTPRWSASPVSD